MKFRSRSSGFRSAVLSACIAATFAMPAAAEAPPEVIAEGNGWQMLLVAPQQGAQGIGALTAGEPAPIVVVDSADGLEASPLPDEIKQELAPEFDDEQEPVSVAVHFEVAEAIAAGTAVADYADFLEPDAEGEGGQAGTASLGCSTDWRYRTRSFERSFDGFHYDKQLSSGGFTGDIKVDAPVTGNGNLEVEYAFKKTAFCLPYTVKFVQARARATLDVGETLLEAQGTAKYATADREVLLRPEFRTSFMVGPIPVVMGAEFPIGAGYDVSASATANVTLKSRAAGRMSVDVICKSDGCSRNEAGENENTIVFEDLVNPGTSTSLSFQADVKPYAFIEARGFLFDPQIASAGAGVEVSAPSRLFFYTGNTCGNGTGATGSELVSGGYVNVGAQIEFYWNTTLFGDDNFNWFDTPIRSVGTFLREVEVDRFLRGGRKHTALRGELYFTDFTAGGGKNPLSPIITGPSTLAMGQQGTFTVSKRPCVPMDETLNYVITWGDGTSSPLSAAPSATASATHTFDNFGTQTITAKMTNDAGGRTINEQTSRTLTVNANAAPPTPGGITTPTSDTDGTFSVSWASTVNTANYQLYRSNNGAAYQLVATVSGTSKSLTAQPFGNNRYQVLACNNIGCSPPRTSNNVLVGVVPSAPVLTVTSALCFGLNDAEWTAPAGATSYRLYASEGSNPNNAGQVYSGTQRRHALNVSTPTNVWVKACGTGGCSGFSNVDSAVRMPSCN